MGRTHQEIKDQMTSTFIANEHVQGVYGLDPTKTFNQEFSLVSFENIVFDIISYSIFILELLFDKHRQEIDDKLYNQKSGRLPWYRFMALKFQYGFDLKTDSDEFDNSNATVDQIEASKIIKYAAVNSGSENSNIIVKIAGETNDVLSPISPEQEESVKVYFEEIKYAGNEMTIINYLPDQLHLTMKIYYDPLVLDANGMSILSGNNPIEDAIKEFMKELPFDGELTLVHLVDKLQLVSGVKIPDLILAESSWIDPQVGGYGVPTAIDVKRVPESGYFEVVNFDSIEYVV